MLDALTNAPAGQRSGYILTCRDESPAGLATPNSGTVWALGFFPSLPRPIWPHAGGFARFSVANQNALRLSIVIRDEWRDFRTTAFPRIRRGKDWQPIWGECTMRRQHPKSNDEHRSTATGTQIAQFSAKRNKRWPRSANGWMASSRNSLHGGLIWPHRTPRDASERCGGRCRDCDAAGAGTEKNRCTTGEHPRAGRSNLGSSARQNLITRRISHVPHSARMTFPNHTL